MTLRVDSASLIAGKIVVSKYDGFGVRGADAPSTGTDGPSVIYPSLSLPADADKQYRAEVVSWPSAGTLALDEDGAFTFTGAPDGSYSFTLELYQYDPATSTVSDLGPVTVTLNVGQTSVAQDVSQDFAVKNSVTVDSPGGFQVFNSVAADAAQDFSAKNSVAKDVAGGFQIFNSVAADAVQDFSVKNAVTLDVSGGFQVFTRVVADAVQDFSVKNVVTLDVSGGGFQVFNRVVADCAQDFAVLEDGVVSVDLSQSFSVRNAVSVDAAQDFAVRNAVSVDAAQDFAVRAGVGVDVDQDFEVFNAVNCDVAQGFGVRNTVVVDLVQGFRVLSAGSGGNCLDEIVEGDATMRDVLRLLLAANVGLTSGAGGSVERFKSLDGTRDRVVTTFDSQGNRQAVVLDVT